MRAHRSSQSSKSVTTWTRRRVALLALAVLVLVGIPITYNAIRARRAPGLYAQWMEYEPPPHMVVSEGNPPAAAQHLPTGGGYFVMPDTEDRPPLTTETPVAHFPPQAKGLQAKIPGACAFLHWL